MGFVIIETITDSNCRFGFEIASERLCKINCLSGVTVESLDEIYEICIFQDYLVLLTEDRDFRKDCRNAPAVKDNRCENNIFIYDLHGTYLWNIGDVVGDIKMPFRSISCIFKAEAEMEYSISLPNSANTFLKCIAGGFAFLIDIPNKKLLCKTAGSIK